MPPTIAARHRFAPKQYLVFCGDLPHATRRYVDVFAKPSKPGLAHDLHRELSPGRVAYSPFTELHSAVRPAPQFAQQNEVVYGLFSLLCLAPFDVVIESAVPMSPFHLLHA